MDRTCAAVDVLAVVTAPEPDPALHSRTIVAPAAAPPIGTAPTPVPLPPPPPVAVVVVVVVRLRLRLRVAAAAAADGDFSSTGSM